MNAGAVCWDVPPQPSITGAVVDISSVGDGSGGPQESSPSEYAETSRLRPDPGRSA